MKERDHSAFVLSDSKSTLSEVGALNLVMAPNDYIFLPSRCWT